LPLGPKIEALVAAQED